jgi:hypothetical protein
LKILPPITNLLFSSSLNTFFNFEDQEIAFPTDRKIICLTGSSGNMGWAGFQEFYSKKDHLFLFY